MDNITLEKEIVFKSQVDSIKAIDIKDKIDYEVSDDNMSARGILHLTGIVKTMQGEESFDETIDVDIYAPYQKILKANTFKLNVKDYNYEVKNNTIIISITLEIKGIEDDISDNKAPSVADSINNINEIEEIVPSEDDKKTEIKDEDNSQITEENTQIKDEIAKEILQTPPNRKVVEKEIKSTVEIKKDDEKKDEITKTWATDLFKLNEGYQVFKVFHQN